MNGSTSPALADLWARYVIFNNCCGPTEISIVNTIQRHVRSYPLSIGVPIPNTNVYILDPTSEPPCALPIGETGNMWVGGIGVSRGYLNLPSLTAARWRPDPFVPPTPANPTPMMLNTGDLGRWRVDGQLDHMGRADEQIKVKGFRVEPDGVASSIRTHPAVRDAVVLLVGEALWGFLVRAEDEKDKDTTMTAKSLNVEDVRAHTALAQPYYAVPSQWLVLDTFPVTARGKVDKRALRDLAVNAKGATGQDGTRLTVKGGGVPYSASLPGTPATSIERSSLKGQGPENSLPTITGCEGSLISC